MKLYYKAVNSKGKTFEGTIDAKDANDAAAYLRTKELTPINIKEKEGGKFFNSLPIFTSKVKSTDIVFFTRQLSSMISAGLTLLKSLEILKEQFKNKAMVEVVGNIIANIEEGMSFAQSVAKHPEVFSPVYTALIRASESSGLLDKALLRLADTLEKKQKLRSTVKSALMYPAIVIILMVAVVTIMMLFVIPQLSNLYKNLNISLPLPTRILVGLSNFTIAFWPVVLGFFVLLISIYKRWRKTQSGQLIVDKLMLKIPVFGPIIRKTIFVEFSRTLGLLLGSGTLVVESLIQSSNVTGNIHYKNAILEVSNKVEKGVTIGDAMSTSILFPQMLVQLVKVGEQTGKLDETLVKASEYFEEEVNQSVKTLTTAMEPFIMVVLGAGVAFLIISVITPIYNLTNSIQ